MNKRAAVFVLLITIFGLLISSLFIFEKWQQRVEEKRLSAYSLGDSLFKEGRYEEAISQFKEIIERYPQSKEALDSYYRIGLSLGKLKKYDDAATYFQSILDEIPGTDYADDIYYQLGSLEEKRGNLDEALGLYKKVIDDFPGGTVTGEALLSQGRICKARGQWKEARESFLKVLEDFPESGSFPEARKEWGDLNVKLIFSSVRTEDSLVYKVEAGDSLYIIAKKFKTTVPLLMKSNGLKGSIIRPGKTLKITPGNYKAVVSKAELTLSLYLNDKLIKVYPVGIGVEDYFTPTGEFKIINKEVDPFWYYGGRAIPPDSPDNILGTRWMGISSPGYGIHGTTIPESVGKKSSQGCIRMLNKDVEELYDLVTIGTPVIINE